MRSTLGESESKIDVDEWRVAVTSFAHYLRHPVHMGDAWKPIQAVYS